ncbi:MAG: trimethylamine methyltransferase family protein, partial [Alphaproteobacteria bacterium]
MSESDASGAGRRKRGQRKARRTPGAIEQRPWAQPRNHFPPIDAVSADELEAIHQTALTVLEEIGVNFLNEEARTIMADAGARLEPDTTRVRIDRHLVETALTTVPSSFTLHARNPQHHIRLGDGYIAYSAVGSAPNCACLDHGRRPGNRADYQTFLKLGQMLNSVHMWGGYPVEPIDLHPATRHLDAFSDMVTMSDKAIHGYSLGVERICDAMEISRISRGVSREQFEAEPGLITIINSNSPLVLDDPMLIGIMEMARAGQIVVLTPFTLAGAMAPVTIAGALAQANAEVLAGMVLSQLVRPGAPFMYGGFTSNVDMKSGAPAFGTPEAMKAALVGGQLARRYGVPYRSSNVNAANGLDMQAAYESVFSLWGAVMGGVNLLKHAAGWMEGGLQASFEKMVLDAD